MGIQNKDGALYFATGVDNTGLYSGRREAIGIIKAMAGEITSFDVFGGIGISAAMVFAKASKDAYSFEKQFQKSMYEVATISSTISSSLTDYMNKVLEVTQRVPVAANDAAKALYQIVSAGHDGADAMEILEVSAKAAIGGVTDTATSADAITTILNAYKMSAAEAEKVSDMLFTTARLGKTTMGELGQSIAQAAPIAASYGVEIDQVLAAVASLTKQGTPTAQAMTQIRAAIIGTSKVLGDGAFNTRTFQEALEEVANRSKGSESKLRELVPEIEAVNGVLGMTGKNAKNAASDLEELGNSTGASEAAFKKMNETADAQLQLLQNNITAALRPLGEAILKEVSDIAKSFNEAFENGDLERILETLEALLLTGAAAWGTYKVATLLAAQAELYHQRIAHGWTLSMQLQANWLNIVSKAKEVFTAKTKALTAVMMKNPYAIAAAAVVALGVGIYKLITYQTDAQKAQEKLNKSYAEFNAEALKETYAVDNVFAALKRANPGTEERKKLIKQINTEYKQYLPALLSEKSSLDEIDRANKAINDSLRSQIALKIKNQASTEMVTKEVNTQADALEKIRKEIEKKTGSSLVADNAIKTIEQHTKEFQAAGSSYKSAKEQALHSVRALFGKDKKEKIIEFEIDANTEDYIKSYYDMKYQQYQIDKKFDPLINKMTTVETTIIPEPATTSTIPGKPDKKDYKGDILNAQKEQQKLISQMIFDIQQTRIDSWEEGEEKYQMQRDLDFKKELLSIQEKGNALIKAQQEIERKQWEEANKNKKDEEKGAFKPKTTKIEQLPQEQKKLLEDMNTETFIKYSANEMAHKKKLYDSLIAQLTDFKSQEEVLTKEWNDKIAEATTTGDANLVERMKAGKEKAMNELNVQMLMQSDEWVKLFGNMDNLTVSELDNLIKTIKSKAKDMKLDPINLDKVIKGLEQAEEKIRTINPFKKLIDHIKEYKKAEDDATKKSSLKDIFKDVSSSLSLVKSGLDSVVGGLKDMGIAGDEETQKLLGSISNIVGSASELASGIATMNPASMISGAVGLITSAFDVFDSRSRKANREIKKHAENLKDLQKQYRELERATNKAIGEYKYKGQIEQARNYQKQIGEINGMISAEQSKKKKKRDDGKIDEWKNQIEDLKDNIEEIKQGIIDELSTTDIYSYANGLAISIVDGFCDGIDDASDIIDGKMKELLRSVISKQFDVMVVQKAMKPMFDAMAAGFDIDSENRFGLSDKELDKIVSAGEEGKSQVSNSLDSLKKVLERLGLVNDEVSDELENGVTGKLNAAMTEGTASELVGLWNMTAMDLRSLLNLSSDHFVGCRNNWNNVYNILEQTKLIATNTEETSKNTKDILEKLDAGLKSVKDELSEIKKNTKTYNSRG
ncbi:phage tail tape measure protein [uncultured Bacteroides sp.]|uniref:phage tail tape measure protein n=1 Tax=uncultured Bacteroides sp. TaxID=162156 RepID=UPI0025DB5BCF|nr:phage tail tape measure protein [uncultured Bacteroides sp.]